MVHQRTQSARQYARPGCCFEKPIVINDDEQTAPTKPRTKPISNHTATWMEAKARGRWQAPTTTTAEPTFTSKAASLEGQAEIQWQGSVYRPSIQAEPPQRCRKRAFADVGDDSVETHGDAKRLRLPELGIAGGENRPNQDTPRTHILPFHPKSRSRVTNHSHLTYHSRLINDSHPASRYRPTNYDGENSTSNLAELEEDLQRMQRKMDLDRAILKDIQRAEERARIREEEKQAREAEMRDTTYRSTAHSSLQMMWQECDRERKAAARRRDAEEREEREEAERKEFEVEQKRQNEISNIEASLKSMWEAHDLERGVPAKIRPGQLSEAGQRRVRERAEKLRRHNY